MNTIQLDECLNSKRLMKTCAEEGKIATLGFPSAFAGRKIKDPEMLQWWNALGVMLITTDHSMAEDHTRFFPNRHKGIVALCNGARLSFSHGQVFALIADFKQRLPEWDSLSIDNAIVEVWHQHPIHDVCVFRLLDGEVEWHESFSYTDPNWKAKFVAALSRANDTPLLS
jgi:hypothetical protein